MPWCECHVQPSGRNRKRYHVISLAVRKPNSPSHPTEILRTIIGAVDPRLRSRAHHTNRGKDSTRATATWMSRDEKNSCRETETVWCAQPAYSGSALNTGFGVDATPNLLTFGRRTAGALKAALAGDVGALS